MLLQSFILIISLVASSTPASAGTTVPASNHPLAAFTYIPCVMCAVVGDAVFFNANTSFPLPAIVSYTWDFGDGSQPFKTTSPSTSHIFFNTSPEKWQVSLTAQDGNGHTDTISQVVVFNILPRFSFVPAHPMVRQPVVFNGTSTIVYSSLPGPVGFSWSFGDGTNGTGLIVKHAYSQPGPYRVIMTVYTNIGNAQVSKTLVVIGFVPGSELVSNFTFDKTNLTVYATFTLNQTGRTLTGTVAVTATNSTTGDVIFARSFNITITFAQGGVARFVLGIPTSPLWLAGTASSTR